MLSPEKVRARLHATGRARARYGLDLAPIDFDRIELAIAWGQGETLLVQRNRRRQVRLTVRRRPVLFVFDDALPGVVTCLTQETVQ